MQSGERRTHLLRMDSHHLQRCRNLVLQMWQNRSLTSHSRLHMTLAGCWTHSRNPDCWSHKVRGLSERRSHKGRHSDRLFFDCWTQIVCFGSTLDMSAAGSVRSFSVSDYSTCLFQCFTIICISYNIALTKSKVCCWAILDMSVTFCTAEST